MFENLSDRLSGVFDRLTKQGALSEEDVKTALREVRVALLEADVSLPVARDFIKTVQDKATGQAVTKSVTPGQQVVKTVHDALIDVLKESKGKAHVVIELKYYGHDEQLEQRVIDIVEQLDMTEEIAIMSLKYSAMQKVRRLRPDWNIGLLSAQVLGNMGNLDVDFLAVSMAMATPAFIRSNQAAGKRVFVWTVNDKMSMFRMMSLGVDGIITDEPALARQVMAERSELNSIERLLIHAAVILGKPLPKKKYRDQSP